MYTVYKAAVATAAAATVWSQQSVEVLDKTMHSFPNQDRP